MKKNIKIRGINIVYDDIGEGNVIVFIHGQPFNRTMWNYQIKEFSQTHRLIIPDLRGYGESEVSDGIVLLDEISLDIIYLLEELNIDNAVFIGLSMGGQIALDIFRIAPFLFKGLVLADTDARAEDTQGYENRIALSNRILADGMEKFTAERIHLFVCVGTLLTKPEIVKHLQEMMTTTSAVGSAAVQRGRAERRDHTRALSSIDFPTLIVVGNEDNFTPILTAEYMHNRISGSKLAVIKDSGHIPNMEQSEKFNEVLVDFLNENKL